MNHPSIHNCLVTLGVRVDVHRKKFTFRDIETEEIINKVTINPKTLTKEVRTNVLVN